ncbi:MAG: DUF4405 domain-containing protein [Phycisphaerae bacterium]|nr:DUF4405 domain-containing protein [Phycisphaerae bacterium]
MSRRSLFLSVDAAAALLMLMMLASGYVLWFVLPPGSNRSHVVWTVSRHDWGEIHGYAGVALAFVAMVHISLHWRWFIETIYRAAGAERFAQRSPRRAAMGLVLPAIVLLLLFVIGAHFGKAALDHPRHRGGRMATHGPIELWPSGR